MPGLEILELINSFPTLGFQDRSRHVSLQKLRRLCITWPTGQAAMFFQHITFPPIAYVSVNTHESRSNPDFTGHATDMLAAIAQSYSNCPSDLTFRSTMSFDGGSTGSGIGITLAIPDNLNYRNDPKATLPLLSLFLSAQAFVESSAARASVLTKMFHSGLPIKDVSSVTLSTPRLTPEALAQTIGQMPRVTRITTSSSTVANNLINALQLPAANSSEELCFTNLSTLEFFGITFSDLPTHKPGRLYISKLQDCLGIEHQSTFGLRKNEIHACSLCMAKVRPLFIFEAVCKCAI